MHTEKGIGVEDNVTPTDVSPAYKPRAMSCNAACSRAAHVEDPSGVRHDQSE